MAADFLASDSGCHHKHKTMEVVLPMDLDFDTLAYPSAPSTPKRIGEYYFSAPMNPTRLSELHCEFDHRPNNSPATVPFAWEDKPGVPKSFNNSFQNDFAFDVSGEFGRDSVSAEDLFDGGVIKLLEPLPCLKDNKNERETTTIKEIKIGRERGSSSSSFSGLPSSRSTRRTKSLSPLWGSRYPWEEEEEEKEEREKQQLPAAVKTKPRLVSSCSTLSATSSTKGSRKWSFKDLFLFRSASDGRAMDRDPLKKYSAIFRKHDQDFRNSSLQSIESGSGSKRRGRISAHELHYAVNRAVSNDMKKKTFLPYKQGILGRLSFNPTVHALSNGFGFSHNK